MDGAILLALDDHIRYERISVGRAQKRTLDRKFASLSYWTTRTRDTLVDTGRHHRQNAQNTQIPERTVVNLSSTPLQENELAVLKKDLCFVPTPYNPPILDLIASAEHGLQSVDEQRAEDIRQAISTLLLRHRYGKSNLLRSEYHTLKQLKSRMDIVITKADKGNVVVVMDMPFYLDRMSTLLSNPV
ncbi:hypothetical protein M514_20864, partial [Trichuris suis]